MLCYISSLPFPPSLPLHPAARAPCHWSPLPCWSCSGWSLDSDPGTCSGRTVTGGPPRPPAASGSPPSVVLAAHENSLNDYCDKVTWFQSLLSLIKCGDIKWTITLTPSLWAFSLSSGVSMPYVWHFRFPMRFLLGRKYCSCSDRNNTHQTQWHLLSWKIASSNKNDWWMNNWMGPERRVMDGDVRAEIILTNCECRSLEMPCILEDCCMTLSKRSARVGTWHPACP